MASVTSVSHRGVWVAPWMGPNGELVLYAIDSRKRLVTEPVTIPHGADHIAIADGLWELLERADPDGSGCVGRLPRFRLLRRSRRRSGRALDLIS